MSDIRQEVVQLTVEINGSPAKRELAELDQEYASITEKQRELTRNTKEYNRLAGEKRGIADRQAELRKEIGLTSLSLRELNREQRRLRAIQSRTTPDTEAWNKYQAQIEAVNQRKRELTNTNARAQAQWDRLHKTIALNDMTLEQVELEMRRLRNTIRTTKPNTKEWRQYRRELNRVEARQKALSASGNIFQRFLGNIKREMSGVIGVTAGLFAGGAIFAGVRRYVESLAEVSDQQVNIQKTTGLTDAQLEMLEKRIGQLNTRTARKELRELAAEGGKLGIKGVEDLTKFVRAGNMIDEALGEDLGDGAIKNIGKLNAIFKVGEKNGLDLEQQMLATGSAINELEASSKAQANFLVDFTNRVAGVNQANGISIQSTLGMAAAIDNLGLKSETSATAISRFLVDAYKETDVYAKIAGKSTEEFVQLLGEDANEAMLQVLDGLNGNNEGMAVMVQKFQDMGENGARAIQVLSSLAANTKLVREQQDIANESFAEGTSAVDEYDKRNSNLAANLAIIRKRIYDAFVRTAAVKGINNMVKGIRDWVKVPLSETLEENRMKLNALHIQVIATNEGTKERVKLIKEMKGMYPELLKDINAETASNKELAAAMKSTNEQLINRIIIQKKQEEIDEFVAGQAERTMELRQANEDLSDRLAKFQERYNISVSESGSVLDQAREALAKYNAEHRQGLSQGGRLFNHGARLSHAIADLEIKQRLLNNATEFGNKLQEEKTALLKEFNLLDTATPTPVEEVETFEGTDEPDKDPDPTPTPTVQPETVDTAEKLREIERRFEEEARIRQDAQNKIYLASLSDYERTIQLELRKWHELIELAKQYGIDTTELEKNRAAAIEQIHKNHEEELTKKTNEEEEKRYRDRVQTYGAVADALGGFNEVVGALHSSVMDRGYEETFAAKALGLTQILVNQGIALSNVLKMATKTDNPISMGAALAMGTGIVLTTTAQAIGLLNSAPDPQRPNTDSTSTDVPQFVPKGRHGMVLPTGNRHEDDGLKVITPTGNVLAEIEGEEIIMSKAFKRANEDQLDKLMAASRSGARINFTTTPVPQFNSGNVRRAIQSERYVGGNYKYVSSGEEIEARRVERGAAPGSGAIVAAINGMRQDMRSIKAKVVLQDLERRKIEYDELQRLNSAR